jgi:hypothetical protein
MLEIEKINLVMGFSESNPLGVPKLKPKGASKLALTVKASLDAPPMVYALPNLFFNFQNFGGFRGLWIFRRKT